MRQAACVTALLLSSRLGSLAKEAFSAYIPPEVQHVGTYRHTIEITPEGTVYVVGRNDFGQLGDGTNVHRSTPWRVKSAVKFVPGLPIKLADLGPRTDGLDILNGPTGSLEEYDYRSERWIVRMNDGAGTTAVVAARLEEIEVKEPLDLELPAAGSRRRSGCRATDKDRQAVYIVHDDHSRNLIEFPTTQKCTQGALKLPDATLAMYLPRYGGPGNEGYELDEEESAAACATVPACTACNTYDDDEVCPNDEVACNPPIGEWKHEKCRMKFTPGLTVVTRNLVLTPLVELNRRTGHLVQYDLRYGFEWEAKLTELTCPSGSCDSGNVVALKLPPHLYQIHGEALDAAAGAFHSIFLWKDSSVWATGKNSEGQLGDGTTSDRNFPKYVYWGVKDVAAGYYHSVFLLENGTAMSVGRNKEGQLGDGSTGSKTRPVMVLDNVRAVSAGAYHTIFLKEDKTVWATGSNVYGQLGDGGTASRKTPKHVFDNVESVIAAEFYSLFVLRDPVTEVTTLYAAGIFDAGLGRSRSQWSPVQFYNETEVQRMTAVF